MSDPNGAAVDRYCDPQVQRWRQSHPDRADDRSAPTEFPTDADRFRLEHDGRAFLVTDDHSTAEWRLWNWLPSDGGALEVSRP